MATLLDVLNYLVLSALKKLENEAVEATTDFATSAVSLHLHLGTEIPKWNSS